MTCRSVISCIALAVVFSFQVVWAQTSIQLGESRQGKLDQTDRKLPDQSPYDWYKLEGRGGERVKVELESVSFTPYLVLLDQDGTELMSACAEPKTNVARIQMTLPYSGKYHLRVNSLHKNGNGLYTLRVKPTS